MRDHIELQAQLSDILCGSRARVNEQYVTMSTDVSELTHFLNLKTDRLPTAFNIVGKEKTVAVFHNRTEVNRDNDVDFWVFVSKDTVDTRNGPRKVALTVFND